MSTCTTYLVHIDGLRAIALMGVLLFHFEVYPFTGGFVGVDVFLTISGYLITRNILASHSKSTPFSLKRFYTRRFFRLYPAATVTILLAVLASFAVLPDDLVKQAAQSGLSAMFLSANTYFYSKSGYFDSSSVMKPFLHMWSLSLEEQFYLLWAPLILLHFLFHSPQSVISKLKSSLLFLCGSSFITAIYLHKYAQALAFFHLPSRIFQFGTGASLAVWQKENADGNVDRPEELRLDIKSAKAWNIESIGTTIAIFIIFISYVVLPENAPPFAVLPLNLATALLLACPDAPICTWLLSSTVPVWVGRLSYSAYLVHWPLYVCCRFVFLAIGYPKPHSVLMTIVTLILSVGLKTCVEDPVRKGGRSCRLVFGAIIPLTILACLAAGSGNTPENQQLKSHAEQSAIAALFGDPAVDKTALYEMEHAIVRRGWRVVSKISRTGDIHTNEKPTLTVFGNSFASHLLPALNLIGKRRNIWFRVYSAPSCGIYARSQWHEIERDYHKCKKFNQVVWNAIDQLAPNSTVVLAKLWGIHKFRAFVRRLAPIATELAKRNLNALFLGEPPGLSEMYESYYDCVNLHAKPVGRILPSNRNGTHCGLDLRKGARALQKRLVSESIYRKAFSKPVPYMKFVNVVDAICNVSRNAKNVSVEALCHVPTHSLLNRFPDLIDPGYKRDMRHLNLLGSAAMSSTYEQLLEDYLK